MNQSTLDLEPNARQRVPSKRERVLAELLRGPRDSRQLERDPAFDHCPNSTVSELKKAGLVIDAERIEVPGFAGRPAWIARYSIPEHGRRVAEALLEQMRDRRRGRR